MSIILNVLIVRKLFLVLLKSKLNIIITPILNPVKKRWRKIKMKTEKKELKIFIIFLTIGIMLAWIMIGYLSIVKINSLTNQNKVYKSILYVKSKYSDISLIEQKAYNYYDLAGLAYEKQDYKGVESYCKIARDYYLDESQKYRDLKAYLKAQDLDDELINIYIKELDASIEISDNMYEACEHFESAARYYDIYYNSNVLYDDMSLEMGGGEISMMNEKIAAHDRAVERFNNLLADFEIELSGRIDEE